jgi:divalent metal cation (Fe/Co/Zn/Cd) transporter
VENVTVHIEPFSTKLHKGSVVDEEEIKQIIRETAENYQQVLQVRRILTYVAEKRRYINIDACFTKQISIENAHEIVSQIETKVRERFAETTVTVHMEPE